MSEEMKLGQRVKFNRTAFSPHYSYCIPGKKRSDKGTLVKKNWELGRGNSNWHVKWDRKNCPVNDLHCNWLTPLKTHPNRKQT